MNTTTAGCTAGTAGRGYRIPESAAHPFRAARNAEPDYRPVCAECGRNELGHTR